MHGDLLWGRIQQPLPPKAPGASTLHGSPADASSFGLTGASLTPASRVPPCPHALPGPRAQGGSRPMQHRCEPRPRGCSPARPPSPRPVPCHGPQGTQTPRSPAATGEATVGPSPGRSSWPHLLRVCPARTPAHHRLRRSESFPVVTTQCKCEWAEHPLQRYRVTDGQDPVTCGLYGTCANFKD